MGVWSMRKNSMQCMEIVFNNMKKITLSDQEKSSLEDFFQFDSFQQVIKDRNWEKAVEMLVNQINQFLEKRD